MKRMKSAIIILMILIIATNIMALAPSPINIKREIIEVEGKYYEIRYEDDKMYMDEIKPPTQDDGPPEGISYRAMFHGFLYGGWLWALIILAIMREWEPLLWTLGIGVVILYVEYKILCWLYPED